MRHARRGGKAFILQEGGDIPSGLWGEFSPRGGGKICPWKWPEASWCRIWWQAEVVEMTLCVCVCFQCDFTNFWKQGYIS